MNTGQLLTQCCFLIALSAGVFFKRLSLLVCNDWKEPAILLLLLLFVRLAAAVFPGSHSTRTLNVQKVVGGLTIE